MIQGKGAGRERRDDRWIASPLGRILFLIWALPGVGISTLLILLGRQRVPWKKAHGNGRGQYGP